MTERWIDLEGCDNARDLGGLPTVDGATTRHGVLVRCDTVQHLTLNDIRLLTDKIGLRTVVDLRTPTEAAAEGRGMLAETDVGYRNVAFVPDSYLVPGDPDHNVVVERRSKQGAVERYLDYLTRPGSEVADALRLLAEPGRLPALFHCAAGKDRTGWAAALLLHVAGADEATILEDYLLTNTFSSATRDKYLGLVREHLGEEKVEVYEVAMLVREDYLHEAYTAADAAYGSLLGYVRDGLGLDDDLLARLRARLRA